MNAYRIFLASLMLLANLSPAAAWDRLICDGQFYGELAESWTFARNAASWDGNGNPVAVDVPRFGRHERTVAGDLRFMPTGVTLPANAQNNRMAGSGRDLNGDKLIVNFGYTGATAVSVYEVDDVALTAELQSQTLFSALPGATGGVTYLPLAVEVVDGTIIILSERFLSLNSVGMTAHYSQDRGVTWTRIASVGGALDIPMPASYGTSANGTGGTSTHLCVGPWSLSKPFDYAGKKWFGITDYRISGSLAKGLHALIFPMERDSEDEHYTVGLIRSLYDQWSPSASGNLHAHSLGLTADGYWLLFVGDNDPHNAILGIALDMENYTTATPTVTTLVGEVTPGATTGKKAPQLIHPMPGPDGTMLLAQDTWYEPVVSIGNMAGPSDAIVIRGPPGYRPSDVLQGGASYKGWETLFASADLEEGHYLVGGYDTGYATDLDPTRLLSIDGGRSWANLTDCEAIRGATSSARGTAVIVGDCIAGIRNSDEQLMLAKIPRISTTTPLLINPGISNKLTTTVPLETHAGASAGNTLTECTFTKGRWVYQSSGLPVSNAPKWTPVPGAPGFEVDTTSVSSGLCGFRFMQENGQTTNLTGYFGTQLWMANLTTNAVPHFSTTCGGSSVTADRITELLWRVGITPGEFCEVPSWGDPTQTNSTGRGTMSFYGGTSTVPNVSAKVLVVVGGFFEGSLAPYPCARLSASNGNEAFSVALAGAAQSTTVTTLVRPPMSATIATADQASGYFFTLTTDDADTYLQCYYDGANQEVECTAFDDGVQVGSATATNVGVWARTTPLHVMVAQRASTIEVSVLSVSKGVSTASITGTLGQSVTGIKFSSLDGTGVYNLEVLGVGHLGRGLTAQQRKRALLDLEWLTTESELLAEDAAAAVRSQLAIELARIDEAVSTRVATGDTVSADIVRVDGQEDNANTLASYLDGSAYFPADVKEIDSESEPQSILEEAAAAAITAAELPTAAAILAAAATGDAGTVGEALARALAALPDATPGEDDGLPTVADLGDGGGGLNEDDLASITERILAARAFKPNPTNLWELRRNSEGVGSVQVRRKKPSETLTLYANAKGLLADGESIVVDTLEVTASEAIDVTIDPENVEVLNSMISFVAAGGDVGSGEVTISFETSLGQTIEATVPLTVGS